MKITELLSPQKIAIIGASADRRRAGNIILRNLKEHYDVYPVNPLRDEIEGLKCYRSINEIEDEIDWAIISLPAEKSIDAMKSCVEKGVKLAIIIAGGFGEAGREEQQEELKKIAGNKCRIMGPNTVGMLLPHVKLNTVFIPGIKFLDGNIAFLAQSGSIGVILMEEMAKEGLGISLFAGLGNRIDVDENEFLDFLEKDEKTEVISLYLESFSDARGFFMKCREISVKKPVILLKAGNNKKSSRAIMSHTGKISSISPGLLKDIMVQNGVVEAHDLEEIVDFSKVFSRYKKSDGGRIAIITSAGGLGVIATDYISRHNELSMAKLDKTTVDKLSRVMPSFASCNNPIDLTADVTNEMYGSAIEIVGNCSNVDMVLCLLQFHPSKVDGNLIPIIEDVSRRIEKPVFYCINGMEEEKLADVKKSILVYPTIRRAMRAMNALAFRSRWLKKSSYVQIGKEHYGNCNPAGLLRRYGIKIPEHCIIENESEIENIKLNFPVACKVHSSKVYHKTDVGGVYLNIKNKEELRNAFLKLKEKFNEKVEVQSMVDGFEFIVGTTHHEELGDIIMCGAGGVMAEVYMDTSFRMLPVSKEDAEEMVRELKISPIFNGYRKIKVNKDRVTRAIMAVSEIACRCGINFEINPLVVNEQDAFAVDIKLLPDKKEVVVAHPYS
ncbi:MAG: acetate--CoA ligase family protein [Thermoplasmata archaeon]|nr:acetate--CoA ligase family protein [Thermoplasmata archaeon]